MESTNLDKVQFKELFELLPDAVVLIDTTTKLPVMYNEVAYTQLGYTKDEFARLTISDYEAIEKPEETQQHIQNIIQTGRDDFETQHKTKQGKLLDIKVTVKFNMIGEIPHFLCVFRDITAQKRVEKELVKSEERLAVAADSANIGVWEYDVVTNDLIWNDQMYKIYGIEKDSFVGAYEAWVSSLHPDDLTKSTELFTKALNDPNIKFSPEFRIVWPDETIRFIKANSKVIRNEQGKALRVVGVNFDITHLKEAEFALKKSEDQFRMIFEKVNCGIAYGDKTGKLILCNEYFVNMTKYNRSEIESMNFANLTHPDDLKVEFPLFEEIVSQKRDGYRLQKRYICKDGEIIWVDLATSVIRDKQGNPVNYLGVVIDITKEKLLEDEIKEKEKRFSDVAKASGEYIWELNEKGEYTFLTKPFEDMMGYSLEESLGRSPFSFMPKDEEIRVGQYFMDEVATKGVPFQGLTHRSLTKEGKIVWQKVNGLPMFDKEGNIIGYRGAALDITAEKKVTQELQSAKQKAEDASKAKTQFLANMSHEIRTPMNAIIGLGDALDDMINDKKQKDMLYKINSSSKMLLGIINDILDYSKIEAGKLELESKSFSINKMLGQLKVMFEQKTSLKNLEFYFHLKGKIPASIYGDQLRLTQVLTNLISNSVKFTNEGIISLTVELQKNIKNEKVQLSFCVEDTGIGMSKEQLKKLFQPFTQADSSTTRKYGGTGLGLVISKNILEAMGSQLEVESKQGVGTKFSFDIEFDIVVCELEDKQTQKTLQKVLIVDDQELSREVLKDMLIRFECSFDEATDGFKAIEAIKNADKQKKPYDLILLDWNMPNLNGVETIKKLEAMYEQKKLYSKPPTVFMVSGFAKSEIDLDSIQIDSFLSKPVTPSDLFDAIIDAKGGRKVETSFRTRQSTNQFVDTHILVVEDNAINQEVISLMLEKVGITYAIAHNGKEGVEKFFDSNKKFDLVLMDLQMPIMGGYEATKEIRKIDASTPIVALTAAAMVEDKQKAFDAGMDEHIGKPIDKNELYRVISKLTSLKIDSAKGEKRSDLVLDMEYLKDTVSSNDRINSLLLTFKKQLTSGEFQDIEKKVSKNNKDAHKLVHTLKGVSGNLGIFELYNILTLIDAKYKKNDIITQEDIQTLQIAKQNILKKLDTRQEIQKSEHQVETLLDDEVYKLFEQVQESLSQGLKIEDQKIEILYENLKQRVDQKELEKWKEYIEDFDFDEAVDIMRGWDI